jgi:hypothetical protein
MKIYLIKHKGKTWWGNLVAITSEMTFKNIEGNEFICYSGRWFFKKKDAEIFRRTLSYWDNLEVVSAEVKNCKKDNRINAK